MFIDRLYMLLTIISVVWYLILESVYRCCLEKKTLSSHQCNLVQNKITISSFGRPCSMFIDRLYMFLKSSVLSGIWFGFIYDYSKRFSWIHLKKSIQLVWNIEMSFHSEAIIWLFIWNFIYIFILLFIYNNCF